MDGSTCPKHITQRPKTPNVISLLSSLAGTAPAAELAARAAHGAAVRVAELVGPGECHHFDWGGP